MQTQASIVIDRPLEDVFDCTVRHVPEWSEVVLEDYVIEDVGDGDVGTTFRSITESNGKKMEFEGEVIQHDPPHAHAVRLTGHVFDIEAAYSFEASGGQTRVTQWSKVHGKGGFGLFLKLFGWAMRKGSCDASYKELQGLKRYCESRDPATEATVEGGH